MTSTTDLLLHSTTNNHTNPQIPTSTSVFPCGRLGPNVRIFNSIILLLVSVIGVLANSLIILSYGMTRKLRSTTNGLVVNLAIADVVVCLLLPVFVVFLLIDRVNMSIYVITIGLVNMCIECGILTATLIAANRFVLITKTHGTYKNIFRTKMLRIWYVSLWLVSFCVATIPILSGIGRLGVFNVACDKSVDEDDSHLYGVIFVVLLIPTPLTASLYCYVRIYKHVRKHNKHLHRKPTPVDQTCSSSRSDVTEAPPAVAFRNPNPVDITHSLFWIVIGSVIFLTPHLIAELVNAGDVVILHTSMFLTVSCCTNPLLYGFSQPLFKSVFKSILFCRWREIPEPTLKCLQVQLNDSDMTRMSRRERQTTVVREVSVNLRKTLSVLEQRANMV